MSDMLCYVDQKPSLSPSGEYNKSSHAINNQAILNQEFENGYGPPSSIPSMNPTVFNQAYHIPGTVSPTSTSMADIGQRMAPYGMSANEYGHQAAINNRLHSTDGQTFGSWAPSFNTFGAIPPPIHMERSFDWERQYAPMHSHPFPMQPPPFALPSTTSSPNSCLDERSPDINGMPFGGQGFFVNSPNTMPHNHNDMDDPLHGIPSATSRRPYEWINKNSYQSLPPPPGKTRTKDKYRVVYTDHQRLELEKEFRFSRYITIRRKAELAGQLCLSERQVKIWFQNRRAKERKINKKKVGGDQDDSQNASNDEDASSDDIKSNDMPVSCKSSDDDSLDFSEKNVASTPEDIPQYNGYTSANVVSQHGADIFPNELATQKVDGYGTSPPVYGMAGECNAYSSSSTVISNLENESQFYVNQPSDNNMRMITTDNGLTLQSLETKVCENKSLPTNDFHPTFVTGNKTTYQSA